MKFSKTAMVAVCGALALAFSGCRYDKSGEDTDATGNDVATVGEDANANGQGVASDIDTVTGSDGRLCATGYTVQMFCNLKTREPYIFPPPPVNTMRERWRKGDFNG